jgi:hypothetical protein
VGTSSGAGFVNMTEPSGFVKCSKFMCGRVTAVISSTQLHEVRVYADYSPVFREANRLFIKSLTVTICETVL